MKAIKGNRYLAKGFIWILLFVPLFSCSTFASIVSKDKNTSPVFDMHDTSYSMGKIKLTYEADILGKSSTKEADVVRYASGEFGGLILSKEAGGFMQSDSALILQGKNLELFHSSLLKFIEDSSQDLNKLSKTRSVGHYGRIMGIFRYGGISFDNEAHPQIDLGYVKSKDNRLFMSVKVYKADNLMGQGTETTTDDYTNPFGFIIGVNNAKALLHYLYDDLPKPTPQDVDAVPDATVAPQATPLPED